MTAQELASEHLKLAAGIAGNVLKRLPRAPAGFVDKEDVHQEARLGLWQAAINFDAGRRVEFGAYAQRRIMGAVLDGLRRNDHLKPHTRAKIRAQGIEDTAAPIPLLNPDAAESRLARPDEEAACAETRRILRDAIAVLPERLQTLIDSYYAAGKTMREIGVSLGVNESRVSQLHGRALDRLRRFLEGQNLSIRSFV